MPGFKIMHFLLAAVWFPILLMCLVKRIIAKPFHFEKNNIFLCSRYTTQHFSEVISNMVFPRIFHIFKCFVRNTLHLNEILKHVSRKIFLRTEANIVEGKIFIVNLYDIFLSPFEYNLFIFTIYHLERQLNRTVFITFTNLSEY